MTKGIMGVIFALLFYKTKSVLPAIFLHSMWNLFVLIMSRN
ncbi:CPBP family glutamic-type intramembrane protease [Priestia megaterium]